MNDLEKTSSGSKKGLVAGVGIVAVGAIAVLFVLPAEFGIDPTGVGAATGLLEIAEPENAELERGMARMETQDVLLLSDTAPAPEEGATDSWEYELAPFDSIEFKYTISEGERMAFSWEGTDELHYDMHSHPFEGGVEATESFGLGDTQAMQGVYIAPFTGIHGWYWQNRTQDNVTVRIEASGGFTHSTIFGVSGPVERPIPGVESEVEGAAAGHAMQDTE